MEVMKHDWDEYEHDCPSCKCPTAQADRIRSRLQHAACEMRKRIIKKALLEYAQSLVGTMPTVAGFQTFRDSTTQEIAQQMERIFRAYRKEEDRFIVEVHCEASKFRTIVVIQYRLVIAGFIYPETFWV